MFICEVSIIILICQKLGLVGSVQQKVKVLSPYIIFEMHHFAVSFHWRTKVYYQNKKKVVAVLGFEVYEVFYQ